MKRSWMLGLQLVITLAAIALLMRIAHPDRAMAALLQANPMYILMAIGVWAVIQALSIIKWQWVNRLQGLRIPLAPLTNAYLVGMFFNTFLPSGFGGDAVRAYKLARYSGATASSLSSVVIDRYLALHSLVAVAAIAVFFSPELRQAVSLPVVFGALVAGSLPFALPGLLSRPMGAGLRRRFPVLDQLLAQLAAPGALGTTAGLWVLAVVIQYANALMHYVLILALGYTVSLPYVLGFIPIMVLLASLPLSVNGLGIREGSLVFFLGKVGMPGTDALAVGLLSLALLLLVGAVGGVLFALGGWLERAPKAATR